MARRVIGSRRMGHCGTLDPMAEGVLVLVFGTYTRKQDEFLSMEKQYWFRSELGRMTDSGDRTGLTTQTFPDPQFSHEQLAAVAATFLGEQWQTPPRISAVKYQGKPLYKWARQGIEVPRAPRQIRIHSFEVLSCSGRYWEGRVVCSRGTYIRTLVEDVAQKLGSGGLVDALIRERIGTYRREDALSWNQLCGSSREEILRYVHV